MERGREGTESQNGPLHALPKNAIIAIPWRGVFIPPDRFLSVHEGYSRSTTYPLVRVPSDIRLNAFFGAFFPVPSCDLRTRTMMGIGIDSRAEIGVIRAEESELEGKND